MQLGRTAESKLAQKAQCAKAINDASYKGIPNLAVDIQFQIEETVDGQTSMPSSSSGKNLVGLLFSE